MRPKNAFHQLHDAAPQAMLVVNRRGQIVALNQAAQRLLGWTEDELRDTPLSRLIPMRPRRTEAAHPGPTDSTDSTPGCTARRRDGGTVPVTLARRLWRDDSAGQSLLILDDLTLPARTGDASAPGNPAPRATLDSIGDAVITTDTHGTITYLNPVAVRLTGWAVEEAVGQPLDTVLTLIAEAGRKPIGNTAVRCLEEGRSIDLEEGVLLVRRDGTEIPIGDSTAPIRDRDGSTVGVVLVIRDEGEKRRVGHRLTFEATHDALTGLINRREFERRLTRVVTSLAVGAPEHVLLYLDLDGFKQVNDTSGHEAGDHLLQGLGALLGGHMRKRDTLARLGGDEFGVLLESCPVPEALRIAESLRREIAQHLFEWEGRAFSLSASLGLYPVATGIGGATAALRAADTACYAAKQGGRDRVHLDEGDNAHAIAPTSSLPPGEAGDTPLHRATARVASPRGTSG